MKRLALSLIVLLSVSGCEALIMQLVDDHKRPTHCIGGGCASTGRPTNG